MNLLWLVPGEVGGSEEYTVGLLRSYLELHEKRPDVVVPEVVLYVNRRFAREYHVLSTAFPRVVAPIDGSSRPWRVLIESTWLAWRTRRDRLDAVHHGGGTMPVVRTIPGLVTLHDLQPITHPERFGPIKRLYIRTVVPRSLRAAHRVVCLAGFTARDAVSVAGVDPGRIALIPSGVDPAGPGPAPERRDQVLGGLGLTDRQFVLYPAITYEHKNHRTLLEAFARLRNSRPGLQLVLTGGIGPHEPQVLSLISELGLEASVHRTGRIPSEDLDVLYRTASVMAFPSSYEGFGLPLLEAMVRGCPVVASEVGGLIEVGGAAVVLVDPFDVDAWADAIGSVLDDDGYRARLIAQGLEQSGHYRWSDSALSLAELYRSLPIRLPNSSAQ
jgi:glycosyltransferase involved in cell wall biosynthesis